MNVTHIPTPNGRTIPRGSLTVISLWDILDYMELREEEVQAIADYGLSNVSYGDSLFTLIGNNFALDCIVHTRYSRCSCITDRYHYDIRSAKSSVWCVCVCSVRIDNNQDYNAHNNHS